MKYARKAKIMHILYNSFIQLFAKTENTKHILTANQKFLASLSRSFLKPKQHTYYWATKRCLAFF